MRSNTTPLRDTKTLHLSQHRGVGLEDVEINGHQHAGFGFDQVAFVGVGDEQVSFDTIPRDTVVNIEPLETKRCEPSSNLVVFCGFAHDVGLGCEHPQFSVTVHECFQLDAVGKPHILEQQPRKIFRCRGGPIAAPREAEAVCVGCFPPASFFFIEPAFVLLPKGGAWTVEKWQIAPLPDQPS